MIHHCVAEKVKALLFLSPEFHIARVLAENIELNELQPIVVFLLDVLELRIWLRVDAVIVQRVELTVESENAFKPLVL
jgi:hypothetical protein